MAYDLNRDIERSVKTYFKDLKDYKPLSKEEEHDLLRKYKIHGDLSARDKLIKSNLKFACSIASAYKGRGVSFSDLISEANDGLIESIEKFDLSQDIKLFSYSVWWIKQRVLSAIKKQEKAETVDIPEESDKSKQFLDEENPEMHNKVENCEPEFIVEEDRRRDEQEKHEFLTKAMSKLSERERNIIKLYYGIGGVKKNLAEIAKGYGITKERTRQIMENALTKVRGNALIIQSKYI